MRGLTKFLRGPTEVKVERGIMFYLVDGNDCDFCMSVHDARLTAHAMLAAADEWERSHRCEVIAFRKTPPG